MKFFANIAKFFKTMIYKIKGVLFKKNYLQQLYKDESVTEICINGYNDISVKRKK